MPRTWGQKKTAKVAQKKTSMSVTWKTTKERSGSKSPATAGNKRQRTGSSGAIQEKRKRNRSLTTADIPDIVTAVIQSLSQSGSMTPTPDHRDRRTQATRTASRGRPSSMANSSQSSHHQRSSNCESSPTSKSLTSESPTSQSGDDGNEDADDEELGKSNCMQHEGDSATCKSINSI